MAPQTATLRSVGFAYLWSILIWLGFSPVLAVQNKFLLSERGQYVDYWTLLLVNGAWCLTAALLTPPIFYLVRRYPIARGSSLWRILGYAICCFPYLAISVLVRWVLLPPWNMAAQRFGPRSNQALVANFHLFGNQVWDYVVILVAAHAYGYFYRAEAEEVERAELQQALAASELQSLKTQLRPHFLFNTMQGISTLIDDDPRRASAMLLRLSSLLRIALEHSNSELISLDDELKFAESYLELQKMRLQDRLLVRWDVPQELRRILVPQLILQPLIENAVVHGIACCRDGGWIEIRARTVNDLIELNVKNSVRGKSVPRMGLGLPNTKARLKYLYSEQGTLSFQIHDGTVAGATMRLPILLPRAPQAKDPGIREQSA